MIPDEPGGTGSVSVGRAASADDDRLHIAMAVVPYLLLGLALAGTLALGGFGAGLLPWLIGATALAVCYRVWWQLWCATPRARVVGFVANFALTLVLVSLSPLYGLYAFVGYLDAVVVFSGTAQAWALVAAGSLNALAQSGGPEGALRRPWLFAFLLLANGGLAVVMVQVDRHRQATVTTLRQTLVELEDARRANESLQTQLLDQAKGSGALEERQRLSREIHDTVAQGLIALIRQIEAASAAATVTKSREILDLADRTARDSLAEARRAVDALASPLLDDADLATAIKGLVVGWSELTGLDATFRATGPRRSSAHDADLLRICQEGLSNVAKHSGGTRVDVQLDYAEATIRLDVCDDGPGFAPGTIATGHGLRGIRERVATAGGELILGTSEGGGCTVSVVLPR